MFVFVIAFDKTKKKEEKKVRHRVLVLPDMSSITSVPCLVLHLRHSLGS